MKKIALITLTALLFSGIKATETKKESFLYREERYIEEIKKYFDDLDLISIVTAINVFSENGTSFIENASHILNISESFPELAYKLIDVKDACNPTEECLLDNKSATELLKSLKKAIEIQDSVDKKTLDQCERETSAYAAYMIVQSKLDKNKHIFEDDQNYNNALKYIKKSSEARKQLINAACGAAINSLEKYLADNEKYYYYDEDHLNILWHHMEQYRAAINELTSFERSLNFNFKNILCASNTLNIPHFNHIDYHTKLTKYYDYHEVPANELKKIEEASILSFKNISRVCNALGMPSYKKQ